MRKSMQKWASIALMGMIFMVSCKDNPSSFSDEPPTIPPIGSMEVDLSAFEDEGSQQEAANQVFAEDSTSNFKQAAFRALIMKVVVEINLAIPRALLEAAAYSDAELNDDEEWVWSYSKTTGEETYEVRLVASREGDDQVNWKLFVTNSELRLENRLFFEGITNNDGSEGSWTYYDLQNTQPEGAVSGVEWQVNGEDDVQLKLEVLSDRNENLGDYIEYAFDGTVKHAVYFNAGEEATTEIQWNVETHEGYLIAPEYNQGEKACWNSELVNTACS